MAAARSSASAFALAENQRYAEAITVDGTHVYWTTAERIQKVPLLGGPIVVLANDQDGAEGIAVDDTHVFWAMPSRGAVRKCRK